MTACSWICWRKTWTYREKPLDLHGALNQYSVHASHMARLRGSRANRVQLGHPALLRRDRRGPSGRSQPDVLPHVRRTTVRPCHNILLRDTSYFRSGTTMQEIRHKPNWTEYILIPGESLKVEFANGHFLTISAVTATDTPPPIIRPSYPGVDPWVFDPGEPPDKVAVATSPYVDSAPDWTKREGSPQIQSICWVGPDLREDAHDWRGLAS